MPKHVRCYSFLAQCSAVPCGELRMLCDEILNAVVAQPPASRTGKEDPGRILTLFANPASQSLHCRSSKWGASLFPSFPFAADVSSAVQVDIALSESCEFREAETRLNCKEQ